MELESAVSRVTGPQEREIRAIVTALVFPASRYPPNSFSDVRFPGSMPVTFGRRHFRYVVGNKYLLFEKSDGTRYLLLVHGDQMILINRKYEMFRAEYPKLAIPVLPAPGASASSSTTAGLTYHERTLFDGELVRNMTTNRFEYLIYDVVAVNGDAEISQQSLTDRMEHARAVFCRSLADIPSFPARWAFGIRMKDYYQVHQIQELFANIRKTENGMHEYKNVKNVLSDSSPAHNLNDGLVFTPNTRYEPKTSTELYKWKYPSHCSVDFRLGIDFAPPAAPGQPPVLKTKLFYMGDGGRDREYREVWFPSAQKREFWDKKMNGAIIECSYDINAGEWRYLRNRDDKDTPNFHAVVLETMESIAQNIRQEDLVKGIMQSYDLIFGGRNARPSSSASFSSSADAAGANLKRARPD